MKIKAYVPQFLISWYHFLLAAIGAFLYGFPTRKLIVIGVTGTNGKTTVVDLITKILEETDYKVASASSIKFRVGEEEYPNKLKMTMPGRFKLQEFFRQAIKAQCKYAVIEVTSEGILQYRHKFINFDIAVFTNLSPEHLERHKGFENYRRSKEKLFASLSKKKPDIKKITVINLDDENAEHFLKFPADEKWGYGINNKDQGTKLVRAEQRQVLPDGIKFSVQGTDFNLKLLGGFNIYNALAAISIALSQGIDLRTCKEALEKVSSIPGRMEVVIKEPFKVIVDYAVTPNALKETYQTIGRGFKPAHLICVLGACGGGRDKWKRPILGKIAAKHCDQIIITNEDPYNEDPEEIMDQIIAGCPNKAEKIVDRREAIKKSLKIAGTGDVVIITGKGSEIWMCLAKGKKIPWDDRQIVREEFKEHEHKRR